MFNISKLVYNKNVVKYHTETKMVRFVFAHANVCYFIIFYFYIYCRGIQYGGRINLILKHVIKYLEIFTTTVNMPVLIFLYKGMKQPFSMTSFHNVILSFKTYKDYGQKVSEFAKILFARFPLNSNAYVKHCY